MKEMLKKIKLPFVSLATWSLLFLTLPCRRAALLLLSILLHESGHILTMKLLGVKIQGLTLLPAGIDIESDKNRVSYQKELAISLSGGAMNILIFLLFWEYEFFACANLLYALLNLLPIKGLDGGSVLESVLLCFLTPASAGKVLEGVSFFFCFLLWAAGIYIMLFAQGNISIFLLSIFLFISAIMKKK